MKIAKMIAALLIAYLLVVVTFESLLGVFQPTNQKSLVITTTDSSGHKSDRVLSRLNSDGKLYVAANHWPRAWYKQALQNPHVEVVIDDEKANYVVVPVDAAEQERVNDENPLGLGLRILTGFPPRYIVRLDPQ